MPGSIDHVLQPDGTYKWEVTELKPKVQETPKASPTPETNTTKKKVAKKKTDSPITE